MPRTNNANTGLDSVENGDAQDLCRIIIDTRRGFQTGRRRTSADSALTDMDAMPTDAKLLPEEGQNIQVNALTSSNTPAHSATVLVYGFPPEGPGFLLDTLTLNPDANMTADGIDTTSDANRKLTGYQVVDRMGCKWVVFRVTAVSSLTMDGSNPVEVLYRVF